MDVLRGHIAQVDLIYFGGNFHVIRHAGRGHDIIQGQRGIRTDKPVIVLPDIQPVLRTGPLALFIHGGHLLHHLKQPSPAGDTVAL